MRRVAGEGTAHNPRRHHLQRRCLVEKRDDLLTRLVNILDSLPKEKKVRLKIKRLERRGWFRTEILLDVDSKNPHRS